MLDQLLGRQDLAQFTQCCMPELVCRQHACRLHDPCSSPAGQHQQRRLFCCSQQAWAEQAACRCPQAGRLCGLFLQVGSHACFRAGHPATWSESREAGQAAPTGPSRGKRAAGDPASCSPEGQAARPGGAHLCVHCPARRAPRGQEAAEAPLLLQHPGGVQPRAVLYVPGGCLLHAQYLPVQSWLMSSIRGKCLGASWSSFKAGSQALHVPPFVEQRLRRTSKDEHQGHCIQWGSRCPPVLLSRAKTSQSSTSCHAPEPDQLLVYNSSLAMLPEPDGGVSPCAPQGPACSNTSAHALAQRCTDTNRASAESPVVQQLSTQQLPRRCHTL